MEVGRESLQQRYADLNDAELLRRLHSVELTELAREVLLEELEVRGLSPEPAAAVTVHTAGTNTAHGTIGTAASAPGGEAEIETAAFEMQDSGAELSADRFDDNPYQAPRAPNVLRAEKIPAPSRLVQIAWWVYIGLLVLGLAVALVMHKAADGSDTELLELAPSVAAIAGLVGWRLRKPLLHPLLWVACLAVILAQLGASLKVFPSLLRQWPEYGPLLLFTTVFGLVYELPAIWGLTRYAFLSGPIWRPVARTQG